MSINSNINEKASLIWAIADKLTGVYKPHEYGEIILPFTIIKRFDSVLADTKDAVLKKNEQVGSLPMKDVFYVENLDILFIIQVNLILQNF